MSGVRRVVGVHPVFESLDAPVAPLRVLVRSGSVGAALRRLLGAAEAAGVPVRRVHRSELDRLAGGVAHQGVVAELPPFPYRSLDEVVRAVAHTGEEALVVACDGVQDPRNLGAILRSAAAFGAQAVVIPKHGACGVTPAVERAAAGVTARLPVVLVTNLGRALDRLSEAGLWVAVADAHGGRPPGSIDLAVPLCLVLGGEAKGPRPGVARRGDLSLTLALPGPVESLNVGAAASVLLYEIARQRALGTPRASPG